MVSVRRQRNRGERSQKMLAPLERLGGLPSFCCVFGQGDVPCRFRHFRIFIIFWLANEPIVRLTKRNAKNKDHPFSGVETCAEVWCRVHPWHPPEIIESCWERQSVSTGSAQA